MMAILRKRKRARRIGSRGFSLVELIVTVAILSIVGIVLTVMMSSGIRLYGSLDTMNTLQSRSQVLCAQLQEYLLDVSGGVCDSGDTVYFTDAAENKLYRLRYDAANASVYLAEGTVADDGTALSASLTDALLCSGVSVFAVTVNHTTDTSVAESVSVEMTLAEKNKSYSCSQLFTFRNRPAIVSAGENPAEALMTAVWGGTGS